MKRLSAMISVRGEVRIERSAADVGINPANYGSATRQI
jgi:hypothetical protein